MLFSIGPADNYLPSAGATWYFQVFFCNMGESQMGKYGFAIWTPRMAASSLVFSTMARGWTPPDKRLLRGSDGTR